MSSSGLLLGLPNNELEKLLQTYSLMNLAKSLRSKFLAYKTGMEATLTEADKISEQYSAEFFAVLDRLKPLLQ